MKQGLRYEGLLRDIATVGGLFVLGGRDREVRLHDLVAYMLEHGYSSPMGGRTGSDLYFACRWLKKHEKPVLGFVVTSRHRGYYGLRRASREEEESWSSRGA